MKKLSVSLIIILSCFSGWAQFTANVAVQYGCGGITIVAVPNGGTGPYTYNFEYEFGSGSNTWFPIEPGAVNLTVNYISVSSPFPSIQLCRIRVVDVNNITAQSNYFYIDPTHYNDPQQQFALTASRSYSSSCGGPGNSVFFGPTELYGGPQLLHYRGPFQGFYQENGTSSWISLGYNSTGYFSFTPPDVTKTYGLKVVSYCGVGATNTVNWQAPSATYYYAGLVEPTGCDANGTVTIGGQGIGPLTYSLGRSYYSPGDETSPPVQKADTLPFQNSPSFTGLKAGYYFALVKDGCGNIGNSNVNIHPYLGSVYGGGNNFGVVPPFPKFPFPTDGPTPCTKKITLETEPNNPGVPPLQYGIQRNPGEPMQWQTSPDFILTEGRYSFSIKDACGRSVYWHERDISVAHPSITGITVGAEQCGRSITINTNGTAAGNMVFGLQKNNGNNPPEEITQANNLFKNVPYGDWIPFIRDDCGRYNGANFSLSDPRVTISVSPYNILSAGQVATFTATVIDGGLSPTFQWQKNGMDIMGATSAVYVDNNPTTASYNCNVTSFATCAQSVAVVSSSNSIMLAVVQNIALPCIPNIGPNNFNLSCIGLVQLGSINHPSGCDVRHYTFVNSPIANLTAGSKQTIKLRSGSNNGGNIHCSVFIDYNRDGDFNDASELVVDNKTVTYDNSVTFPFTIPADAAIGNCVMRVMSESVDPCSTNSGEVEDYVINIQPVGSICIPVVTSSCNANHWISNVTIGDMFNNSGCSSGYEDYSAFQSIEAIAGGTLNYSVTGSNNGYNVNSISIYVDYNKDGNFSEDEKVVDNLQQISATPLTGTFTIRNGIALGDYQVRVVSEAFGTQTDPCNVVSGEAEDYILSIKPFVYCHTVSSPCGSASISNVAIGNMANSSSTCGNNGYSNYSKILSINAVAGETLNYSVKVDFPSYSTGYANIFVDYNNDGDFDDADERVVDDIAVNYYNAFNNGTFTLPAGLAPGKYRLRVALDAGYGVSNNLLDPCNVITEIEDYTLNIVGSSITYCVPAPTVQCAVSIITNVSIGSINNNSTCNNNGTTPGYNDYSASQKTNVFAGKTVSYSIATGGSYGSNYAKIYVDYNGDGSFNDNEELVAQMNISIASPSLGQFEIPAALPPGNYRLRVICDIVPNQNNISGCTTSSGEAEDYTLVVPDCPAGPDINLRSNNNIISAGGTPNTTTNTDFGNVEFNATATKTYTIRNTGSLALNIIGYGFSGTDINLFSVTTAPDAIVAPGGSTSITVQFTSPADYSYGGIKTATLHINSDDCDESNFAFGLKATAICPLIGPDIKVFGNKTAIKNNIQIPAFVDSTDFGNVTIGTVTKRTYTIRNTGNSVLHITNVYIQGSYSANQFTLVTPPASSIAAGDSSKVVVQFAPVNTGNIFDFLLIYSDDCDEGNFNIKVQGTGMPNNITWTGAVNNLWNVAGNWDLNRIPVTADVISVPIGAPQLNIDFTVAGSLILSGTGTLTINPNNVLTISGTANFGDKPVTIKSTAAGTGSIGGITGTLQGATNVTVERYIAANNNRAYRLLSSTVNTAGNNTKRFIYDNWQEGGTYSAGLGTHITGNNSGTRGFDVTAMGNISLYTYNFVNNAFEGINNTNATALDAKTGYLVYISGDRTPSHIGVTATSGNTTLRATGSLLTGQQEYTLRAGNNKATLVTNPYSSAIDWKKIYEDADNGYNTDPNASAIKNFYYYVDPNIGDSGNYVTVTSQGALSTTGVNGSIHIQSGQSFFVKTASTATPLGTLHIKESHKSPTNNIQVLRTGGQEALGISLFYPLNGSSRLADGSNVLFNNNYSAGVDGYDADNITSLGEDLYLLRDGAELSIEGRPLIDQADTLFLGIGAMRLKNYHFEFYPSGFNAPGLQAFLQDKFLNTETPISLVEKTTVPFSVTSNTASSASDRFRVVFRTILVLPINFTLVKAYEKGNAIQVEWNMGNELNVKQYEIEKSADGRSFTKGGTRQVRAQSSTDNYQWLDQQPITGNNYYRIKAIENGGDIKYSQIVNVSAGKGNSTISVYPNPVNGTLFNVQLVNQPAGKYAIQLINNLGQQVYRNEFNHVGGSATETLQISNRLSKGVYNLQVTGNAANHVLKLVVE